MEPGEVDSLGEVYDFDSIMHYARNTFSRLESFYNFTHNVHSLTNHTRSINDLKMNVIHTYKHKYSKYIIIWTTQLYFKFHLADKKSSWQIIKRMTKNCSFFTQFAVLFMEYRLFEEYLIFACSNYLKLCLLLYMQLI